MDTTQIIEAMTKLSEMDLQEVIEAIEGHVERNNMNHLIRSYSNSEYEELQGELEDLESEFERRGDRIEDLDQELHLVKSDLIVANGKIQAIKNILG